jgi:kynurenine formamidase
MSISVAQVRQDAFATTRLPAELFVTSLNVTLVDLSVALGPHISEAVPVELEPMSHCCGGDHLAELAGTQRGELQGELGWASERVSAITHSSTHIDSPFHYAPKCAGQPSRTIDEMPLDWFCGKGVCIAVKQDTEALIGIEEVLQFELEQGYRIQAGDIVLFHTGAEAFYGVSDYNEHGRGLSPELVRYLVKERSVRLFGTDAWSIDPPFHVMHRNMLSLGKDSVWGAHYVGRDHEFCAMEKLTNLSLMPAYGFWLTCYPIKVKNGSAGWVRAVAYVPQGGLE